MGNLKKTTWNEFQKMVRNVWANGGGRTIAEIEVHNCLRAVGAKPGTTREMIITKAWDIFKRRFR